MSSTTTTQAVTYDPASPSPEDVAAIARLATYPHFAVNLVITLVLNQWPDLSLAVREGLGGADSADKRDWMCGEITDLVKMPTSPVLPATTTPTPQEAAENKRDDLDLIDDLVDTLDHMLVSEFDTEVEADDGVYNVATQIVSYRRRFLSFDPTVAPEVYHRYQVWKSQKNTAPAAVRMPNSDADSSDDDDSEDEDPESNNRSTSRPQIQDDDIDMVDDDGFTTVRRKGKR